MQGKNVLGLHKTVWDVLGGAKCGEREGSGRFGEEQVWENRRVKGLKGSAVCEQWLVSKPVHALHLISRVSPVSLLSSFSTLEWGALCSLYTCVCVCMGVCVPAAGLARVSMVPVTGASVGGLCQRVITSSVCLCCPVCVHVACMCLCVPAEKTCSASLQVGPGGTELQ